MIAAVLALGAVIGISLGALGGGGSTLTVPALVYALGQPARSATTASLVIVGITALSGAIGHARAGRVRWKAGIAFGIAGVATSFAGTWANRMVDPNVLLLAFAGLMVVAAAGMVYRTRSRHLDRDLEPQPTRPRATVGDRHADARPGARAVGPARQAGPRAGADDRKARPTTWRSTALKVTAAGLAVGFLTGFFGVGGGFVIVPALTLALGYTMPDAVGTSLLVIAINSAAALAARAGHETFHWSVIIPFTAAAILGSLAGKRLTDRVSSDSLTKAFAVLLILLAVYVAVRSIAGLG